MRMQPFGTTGHDSSALIFGAFAVGSCNQEKADFLLGKLLEHGVNHIDTARSYADAELRIGPWMAAHRNDFFLATKTERRTYEEAKKEIHESLDRLQVECVDLIQLHNLVNPEEWQTALADGGALQAAVEAREEGKVRFIGVTGHGLTVARMHLRSLEAFPFDAVLLPWNYVLAQEDQYSQDFHQLCALCKERGVAVQTIKGLTRRPWGQHPKNRTTWYQPLEDQANIDAAVSWILGQSDIFLNSAGDPDLLPAVLDAASRFTVKPNEAIMEAVFRNQEMATIFPN